MPTVAAFDFGAQARYVTAWASVNWHSGRPTNSQACAAATASGRRGRIGIAHVLAGQDHQPPGEEPHVFAPFEHPGQPVEGRVGIAAANALDQRADRVVMRVAVAVVLHRLALDRLLGQLAGELDRRLVARQHADLQRRERPAGVAVAHFGQKLQGVVVQMDLVLPEAALACRPPPGGCSVLMSSAESGSNWNTRLRLTSALLIVKNGILGRRADQDHHAVLDVGQQHVLLGLVEAVDFVDEQQRSLAVGREPIAGRGEDFAQFLHAAGDRADLAEVASRGAGQQPGERGLARAGRAVEDHRPEPIGRQQPPQQFALAEEMLLADELVERSRPHPRRQRLGFQAILGFSWRQRAT